MARYVNLVAINIHAYQYISKYVTQGVDDERGEFFGPDICVDVLPCRHVIFPHYDLSYLIVPGASLPNVYVPTDSAFLRISHFFHYSTILFTLLQLHLWFILGFTSQTNWLRIRFVALITTRYRYPRLASRHRLLVPGYLCSKTSKFPYYILQDMNLLNFAVCFILLAYVREERFGANARSSSRETLVSGVCDGVNRTTYQNFVKYNPGKRYDRMNIRTR